MTILLIDADIVAFQAAARNETWTDFGREVGSLGAANRDVDEIVDGWKAKFGAESVVMALSTRAENFRSTVLPTYKMNRVDKVDRRPAMLKDVKQYISDNYHSELWDQLEGDDVLGILQTDPDLKDTLVISEDKDMRTFPGNLYAPHRPEVGVIDVTQLEADQFLMWQTVVGDPTDGYGGVKGVGKNSVYAEEILQADADELWDIVLCAYASKGLTEEDALVQARCAKILTSSHYCRTTGEIKLWTPEDLL